MSPGPHPSSFLPALRLPTNSPLSILPDFLFATPGLANIILLVVCLPACIISRRLYIYLQRSVCLRKNFPHLIFNHPQSSSPSLSHFDLLQLTSARHAKTSNDHVFLPSRCLCYVVCGKHSIRFPLFHRLPHQPRFLVVFVSTKD